MKKFLAVLMAVCIACLCLVGCSTTSTQKQKITLSEVTHSVFYAPQYAAMKLGYFEEEGIELELVNGQGADKVMTSVISGEAQIGLAGPEASIYVYNEGKQDYAKVFAQLTKRDGSFLVGREPNPNFTYDDLKGKYVIGGRKGGVPLMTFEYVLRQKGLSEKDLTVDTSVQFALMAGAFTGGTGDYVTLFEPTASMVEKEGKGYILSSIGQDSGEIPYTVYFANKSYVEKNPKIIESFTRAVYRGQQWIKEATPEKIAETVAEFFPDTSIEILTSVAKRYKEIDAWNQDPVMKRESFDKLQEVMEQANELSKRAPYDEIVTTEFAEKVMK